MDDDNEIEGTTNRVASVTLESDSLSEAPLSTKSKRRRKVSKKDRMYNASLNIDTKSRRETERFNMEWEGLPYSDVSSACSSCSDNQDADDEQSDWPGYHDEGELSETLTAESTTSRSFVVPTDTRAIPNTLQKRIERFLNDPNQKEMYLRRVYKTANIHKMVKNLPLQVQKRERGMIFLVIVVVFGIVAFFFLALNFFLVKRIPFDFTRTHAFVTGGSKGIGKEIAIELVRHGCRTVSIAARNRRDLEVAVQIISSFCKQDQTVRYFELDVATDYKTIETVIQKAVDQSGPIDILVNNAGFCAQAAFDELPIDSFESQMKINYLSGVYASRAVVESMKSRRRGHITFVSSAAGQCAIWGYTAYSPSKFAIRGFAEALHMELTSYNIGVSVLYPPNTDTEGYKVELETMPEEVKLISDSAGNFTAKDVAQAHVKNMQNGEFSTSIGFEGHMLSALAAGGAPEPNVLKAITQIVVGGLCRGIMLFFIGHFHRVIKKCAIKKTGKCD